VPPHIVIFNPDQWRGDMVGHLGNPAAHTPTLDALASSEATSFRHAFCQNPVCVPSRCGGVALPTRRLRRWAGERLMQHRAFAVTRVRQPHGVRDGRGNVHDPGGALHPVTAAIVGAGHHQEALQRTVAALGDRELPASAVCVKITSPTRSPHRPTGPPTV
jgi:hypothetical protein